MEHQDRYIPAHTNGGWGIAGGVIALAVACAVLATVVYNKTYKHPTDVTWHGVGSGTSGAGH